jgi:Rrf2 family nitric oxide-sensitive transcriptional repressor
MQLSSFADYALRVLIFSAAHEDRWCTSDEVSESFGVSKHHIVKIVNALQHQGYLDTMRGRGGGFRLAQDATRVNIGEVIRRNEPTLALVECFDRETNTCPLAKACGLQGALRAASDAFFRTLDQYTLADMISRPQWNARVLSIAQRGGTS